MSDALLADYHCDFKHGRDSQQIINWVDSLPPMPAVAARALRLIDDPHCTAGELAAVLSHDASFASQVLRVVNSAAASRAAHVSSLTEAVQIVGFRYVKGIVMAAVTRRWNSNFTPVARAVWERSMGAAVATRVILSQLGEEDTEKFFIPGLLHNLGQMVMLSHPEVGHAFQIALKMVSAKSLTFSQAEYEVIGFSHPLVGALVAQKWGFPLDMCAALLYYDDPVEPAIKHDSGAGLTLKLASLISLSAGIGTPPNYPLNPGGVQRLAAEIGLPGIGLEDELARAVDLTKAQFMTESSLYS